MNEAYVAGQPGTPVSTMDEAYTVGSHWLFFIPPGWLIGGTVARATSTEVVLSDVAYLESAGADKTNVGDVPMATTSEMQKRACATSHQLPDGTRFLRQAILFSVPCAMDLTSLSRRNAANAVKRSK